MSSTKRPVQIGLYLTNQHPVGSDMVEPGFADLKFNRKVDRFQRRGRSAAGSEWRLLNARQNLLKLHRHQLALAGA
jgi:hypothetical protein